MNVYLMEAKSVASGKTVQTVLKYSERDIKAAIKRELQNNYVTDIRVWAKPSAQAKGTWDAPTFKITGKLVYWDMLYHFPTRRSDKHFLLLQYLRRNPTYQTLSKPSMADAELLSQYGLTEAHPDDHTMYKITAKGMEYLTVKNWWSPKKFRAKPSRKISRKLG